MNLRRFLGQLTHRLSLAGVLIGLMIALSATHVRAEVQSPDELVRKLAAEMTQAVRNDQKQIIIEFGKLLTRTYSNAIASLKDLDVEVKSTRVTTANVDVTVKTQMIGRPQPVAIDYGLINGPGGWKVYDVTVEGISLVAAYRDEFNGLVSSSGVQGVIDALKKKNGD